MGPFDFRGPQYLAFYAFCGVAILAAIWSIRYFRERGLAPRFNLTDPYSIATLRGGPVEAISTCIVSLIDRGLLEVQGAKVQTKIKQAGHPLEQAVLDYFVPLGTAQMALRERGLKQKCAPMERELERLGLLPDENVKGQRRQIMWMGIALLAALAVIKLFVAYTRGRSNVQFLILLWIIFTIAAVGVGQPLRTARGDAAMTDLRNLLARLRQRVSRLEPGQAPADLALMAGVFGVMALPEHAFPHQKALFPRAVAGGSGSSDAWWTSAGGSSSCGSSCGGGGCGGGCGGCGS
jgi:uncharacterized protein (TIGR04222 family)